MPVNKIAPSRRAKAAIAAALAGAVATGYGTYTSLRNPGLPAAVELAKDTLVRPWEGRELRAYQDIVGVWTICDGDTDNVKPGMVETPAGCDKRLVTRLVRDFYNPLTKCIAGFEKKPISWQAMMISLSYNVGTGAGCKSSAARLGREAKYYESCLAATAFNKAGGKMVVGLVRRREMGDASRIGEAELCVSGLELK